MTSYGPPDPYQPPYQPTAAQYYSPPAHRPPAKPKRTVHWLTLVAGMLVGGAIVGVSVAAGHAANTSGKHVAAGVVSSSESTSAAPTTEDVTTPDTPTPTEAATFKVRQSVTFTQGDDAGEGTVAVNAIYLNKVANNQFETPDNGQWVVADITVRCTTGSCDYNPYDFTVTTPDLRSWTTGVADFAPSLSSGTLKAGQAVRGNVPFDVSKGKITGVNLISSGFNGTVIATWTP